MKQKIIFFLFIFLHFNAFSQGNNFEDIIIIQKKVENLTPIVVTPESHKINFENLDVSQSENKILTTSKILVTVSFFSILGLMAILLLRYKKKIISENLKNEKPMQIVSSLNLGQKKHLTLVKIRNK